MDPRGPSKGCSERSSSKNHGFLFGEDLRQRLRALKYEERELRTRRGLYLLYCTNYYKMFIVDGRGLL